MAQYDLYAEPGDGGYLMDVQSDLLHVVTTRVVVPLLQERLTPKPFKRMNPVFEIFGVRHVLATQLLAAAPSSYLRTPVGNLRDSADTITAALDMVFHGF